MKKIRLLEKEFTKKGIVYCQIERNEEKGYYIYKCERLDYKDTYFEVFKIITQKPNPFAKDKEDYDLVEVYPSDNSFGQWAWCCSNMEIVDKVINNKIDKPQTCEI